MKAGRCNGMKSPFRWLVAAARYAAASVMTVLMLIVMVKGMMVLLQPVSLSLSVAQGCMFVRRIDDVQEPKLEFQFTLRLVIPRSGARTYLRNVTVYLFGKDTSASSSHPDDDCLVFFVPADLTEPHKQQQDVNEMVSSQVPRDKDIIDLSFFDILYNRSHHDIVSDVTMRLDGTVFHQLSSTSSYNRNTTYYCWPLVVGLDPNEVRIQGNYWSLVLEDVFCREEQGKHLI